MEKEKLFNIRIYGIIINDEKKILVADEKRFGISFTKFPGGGLEFGEGTIDCLKRECLEELGQEIEVSEHFYTTDFFQESAFNKNHQLISIYYLIKTIKPFIEVIPETCLPEKESFRWIPLKDLSADIFRFPIDKIVAEKLKEKFLF